MLTSGDSLTNGVILIRCEGFRPMIIVLSGCFTTLGFT